MTDLMLEYHKRTDHGRDGYKLDERVICNCRQLFEAHDLAVLGQDPDLLWIKADTRWPTPHAMRQAADALDQLCVPRYGDVLRRVAAAEDVRWSLHGVLPR